MEQNQELERIEIYKAIVDNMGESVWIGDNNNTSIYANPNFYKLLGYNVDEIIGKNSENFLELKEEKTHTDKYEGVLTTKKGVKIPVLCSETIPSGGGKVLIMTDLREVNSLKKIEEDLRKLNNTKDEFISIVGHELRTPLTSIRGYLSMILDGDMGDINKDTKSALTHSYDSSVRLINLVNDILSIGKIESGKMEYNIIKTEIIQTINSAYKDLKHEIEEKGIKFILDIDENIIGHKVNIDKDKFKQVLINLLINAYKFTNSNGKITFKSSLIEGKNIRIEIIDTGEGIAKEKIKTLFNKFTQVESTMQRQNTTGLGLGLSLCKNFIEAFESQIKIKSEIGKGSNFYFDLKIIK